jgi:pyruvate dehydrogenase E2 component (dihydrolipoamide acetyltransferase)
MEKVFLPQMGQTVTEATIERWLKKEGDKVEKGEVLLEITTDKATVEVESLYQGVLRKIIVPEKETVPVLSTIALIGEKEEPLPDIEAILKENQSLGKGEEEEKIVSAPPLEKAEKEEKEERFKASPAARRRARELGLDLALIRGTGPEGRITLEDVENYQPSSATPLSAMRRIVAEKMTKSKTTIPHFYLTNEVNVSKIITLRNQIFKEKQKKISFHNFILKALGVALKEYPALNSSFQDERIVQHKEINIGLAVSLEDGLVVPVVRNVDQKTLFEISQEAEQLIDKALNKKLLPEDFANGTFTLSNLGMFEITSFFPIIRPPEAAILGMGKIKKGLRVKETQIEIVDLIAFGLSCDHRVVDGKVAASFLTRLKQIIEEAKF